MVSQAVSGVHERCFDVLVAKHPHTKRAEELRAEAQENSEPEDSIWHKISRLQKKAVGKHSPTFRTYGRTYGRTKVGLPRHNRGMTVGYLAVPLIALESWLTASH